MPLLELPLPALVTRGVDGKAHALHMAPDGHVPDAAMAAGLDLPFSCKGSVCATCRCKVTQAA